MQIACTQATCTVNEEQEDARAEGATLAFDTGTVKKQIRSNASYQKKELFEDCSNPCAGLFAIIAQ